MTEEYFDEVWTRSLIVTLHTNFLRKYKINDNKEIEEREKPFDSLPLISILPERLSSSL